jgi:tyrosine-protein phosphatase SIW14
MGLGIEITRGRRAKLRRVEKSRIIGNRLSGQYVRPHGGRQFGSTIGRNSTPLAVFLDNCHNPAAPGPRHRRLDRRAWKESVMTQWMRWLLAIGLALAVGALPALYFRWQYTHAKRLREVVPGHVYRSGQMTVGGFEEAVAKLGLRTIVNLQDEYPDPDVALGYFTSRTMKETELCRQLGVRYVYIPPDLIPRKQLSERRPESIDRFLELLDDPTVYPVLIHCKAGLHRTGVMAAVYRMEYQGWSKREAIRELKANGFADFACTSANDYITQYVLSYQPGKRGGMASRE